MTASRTLTRRELYDLVWSTPLQKLASDFGLSDVGLKKVCDRHRVPTPPRGYWAKLQAGQKPKKTGFYASGNPSLDHIVVQPSTSHLPEPVRAVIETHRAERQARTKKAAPAAFDDPLEPVLDVHPAIRRTAQALRRAKPSDLEATAFGDSLCGVKVGFESIERAIYVLDGLARGLACIDLHLTATGNAMKVVSGKEAAAFTLLDRRKTVPHIPTQAELEEEAKREKRRERTRHTWSFSALRIKKAYPEHDWIWVGELSLQIEGYSDGVRRRWSDGKTQRLEKLVPSIVEGIAVLLAARRAERERQEEQSRIWEEARRRMVLADARREREKKRETLLNDLVQTTDEAAKLRAWLAVIPDKGLGEHAVRMREWAMARLRRLEDLLSAIGLDAHLASSKLFPSLEADELHDPLGEPPARVNYWDP